MTFVTEMFIRIKVKAKDNRHRISLVNNSTACEISYRYRAVISQPFTFSCSKCRNGHKGLINWFKFEIIFLKQIKMHIPENSNVVTRYDGTPFWFKCELTEWISRYMEDNKSARVQLNYCLIYQRKYESETCAIILLMVCIKFKSMIYPNLKHWWC